MIETGELLGIAQIAVALAGFVFVGGEPPFPLLQRIGIRFGSED